MIVYHYQCSVGLIIAIIPLQREAIVLAGMWAVGWRNSLTLAFFTFHSLDEWLSERSESEIHPIHLSGSPIFHRNRSAHRLPFFLLPSPASITSGCQSSKLVWSKQWEAPPLWKGYNELLMWWRMKAMQMANPAEWWYTMLIIIIV